MPTLIEREARLAGFLRTLFPGHTVVPSLQAHQAARGTDLVYTPEIRILPDELSGEGILRWKLEFAVGDLHPPDERRVGPAGLLASIQALRAALPTAPAAYRPARGAMARRSPVADAWEEFLEEPYAPPGAVPQALFATAAEYGFIPAPAFPAGTSQFGLVIPTGSPAQAGDHLLLVDAAGFQYVGAITATTPVLRTALPTVRATGPLISLYRLTAGAAADEAGEETETWSGRAAEQVQLTLDGERRKRLLGADRTELAIRFPLARAAARAAWEARLAASRARPSLLLVRSDRSLAEVTLLESRFARAAQGAAASFSITFLARPVTSLAPFAEPGP